MMIWSKRDLEIMINTSIWSVIRQKLTVERMLNCSADIVYDVMMHTFYSLDWKTIAANLMVCACVVERESGCIWISIEITAHQFGSIDFNKTTSTLWSTEETIPNTTVALHTCAAICVFRVSLSVFHLFALIKKNRSRSSAVCLTDLKSIPRKKSIEKKRNRWT